MTLRFQFVVKNKAAKSQRVKIQFESSSPVLLFRKTQSKRMSKSRLYAKMTTLTHVIDQRIPPNEEATYDFLAEYAPYSTSRLPSELTLFFGIFVYDEKNAVQIRFGPRKIKLPITDGDSHAAPVNEYII